MDPQNLPRGFRAGATATGVKASGKPDLSILYSEVPCAAAAVMTQNRLKGAALYVTSEHLRDRRAQAVVINSGVANGCTGDQGMKDAREMARLTAEALHLRPDDVLVASTGIIGEFLPLEKIARGIREVAGSLSPDGGLDAAKGIMTTDTVPKVVSKEFDLDGGRATIWGMCKGAGMIHPRLATMLGFILTDAPIAESIARPVLLEAVRTTFNRLTVDGDMSPSDTVMLLANRMAGGPIIDRLDSAAGKRFQEALREVCGALAEKIARDGEGATKLIRIEVTGASDEEEAERIARGIATSNLVKTAIAGGDPNWGRIVSALGQHATVTDPNRAKVRLGDVLVYDDGVRAEYSERKAAEALAGNEVTIHVHLAEGKASARYLTCDFTEEYVKINADYHT